MRRILQPRLWHLTLLCFVLSFGLHIAEPSFVASQSKESNCLKESCFTLHSSLEGQGVELRGMALLRYWGFKVYSAALFLRAGDSPLADVPKAFTLKYHRDFSAEDFINSGREVAQRNQEIDFKSVEAGFKQMDRLYRPVKQGDSYTLTYVPGKGTSLFLNDQYLGTVPGADFAKSYFGIWLSQEYSLDEDFTSALLNTTG